MQRYLEYLQRSFLCLSPAGVGYDCFRHYEIMLAGSIPVINLPDEKLLVDLAHGKNCFLYNSIEDLIVLVEVLLQDRENLITMGAILQKEVRVTHDIDVFGRRLL